MSEWISIKTRLPPTKKASDYNLSDRLLCLVNNNEYLLLEYQFGDEDGGWTSWYCRDFEDSVENVTHWMPLPKPPKQKVKTDEK